MKNLIISVVIIVYCFLSFESLYAQNECWVKEFENKLQVNKMVFNITRDTLYVTIKNNCDSCVQKVYTGIIVYRGKVTNVVAFEDTLAIDKKWTTEATPDNNAERTYTAIVKKDFNLSQSFKVGLFAICDSIPLSPDIILGLKKESINDKKKCFCKITAF
jgi:hypothetical protein